MLNILHIIESLEFGGAEKVVVHLANKLCDQHNIMICVTKRSGELCKQLDPRIKVICLHGKEGNDLRVPVKLSNIISNNDINIIHTHDWGIYLEAAVALVLNRKCKMVHTVHGSYMPYSSSLTAQIKLKFRHLLEKTSSLRVSMFVAVSKSIKDYIQDDIYISHKKIMTIHNGIEGHQPRSFTNAVLSPLKLITVGRLAPVKQHKVMIDAVKLSINDGIKVTLTIVGDGPEYDNLVDYVKTSGLHESIKFKGFRTDIDTLLADHHVFVLSSDYEGISIALLEAMSTGLSSISTDVGGIPDTIIDQKTGILVDKGDSANMAKAIRQLATNPSQLEMMGINAYNHFVENFHESVVLDKYNTLYRACVK